MENNKVIVVGILATMVITIAVIFNNSLDNTTVEKTLSCKEDSLQSVVNNLQGELKNEEDGWDKKEQRYEDILFEYEYGLDRLKETHPNAYKEFHKTIAFKQRYSMDDEYENKKRLKDTKW